MAISFVGQAAYEFAGTANTSIRATMPSGIQAGDLLVVGFGNVENASVASTPESGWVTLEEDTSGTNAYYIMLAKIATSTEVSAAGTNIQVAVKADSTGQTNKTSMCVAYRGTHDTVAEAVIASNMKHESSPANLTIETNAASSTQAESQWYVAFYNMASGGDQSGGSWSTDAGVIRGEAVENNGTSTTSGVGAVDSNGTIAVQSHERAGTWSASASRLNASIAILDDPDEADLDASLSPLQGSFEADVSSGAELASSFSPLQGSFDADAQVDADIAATLGSLQGSFEGDAQIDREGDLAATMPSLRADLGPPFQPGPTNVVATTVSISQIDLTWTGVVGDVTYQVERDGVIIASDLEDNSYSDTGLDENTTYTYRVRAEKVNP